MAERKTRNSAAETEPASRGKNGMGPAALVIGAGVGGMRAALDIAESGHKVYLLDRSPRVGGTSSRLDKWFPTDDCSLCKLLPTFYTSDAGEFCLIHPRIELLTSSELAAVDGQAGDFRVTILRKPQMVDRTKCIGCNKCLEVCPIEVEDEFNEGLASRKAVYLSHPNAVPNNFVIDMDNCDRCGKCAEVCPTGAIALDAREETLQLRIGAIVADPGFESFGPGKLQEFGYSKYPNVVTSIEFERMMSGTGPGRLQKVPRRVAFFQCVGSRDEKRPYCSSACCMYAIKEANLLKEEFPDSEASIFYMDLRAFGKGYYRYYKDAVKNGVRFVRSRVPAVQGITDSQELLVSYEDESGRLRKEKFDIVVLSIGQTEPASTREMAQNLGIQLNSFGFCESPGHEQVGTSREGVFVCGSFSSPADIPDTVIRASAAACEAVKLLPAFPEAPVSIKGKVESEPSIGVFLCSCGEDIRAVIDLEKVAQETGRLPYVKAVSNANFMCVTEGLTAFAETVKKEGINRVVVAACSVHPYEMLFRKTAEAAGADPAMLSVVNIREQLSWVHEKSEEATRKAKSLVEAAVQNAAKRKAYPASRQEVVKRAVVIGGGLSGMTAALDLAERSFEVELVERTDRLGGWLLDKPASFEGENLNSLLKEKTEAIRENPGITTRLNFEVKSIEGSAGNFIATLVSEGKEETVNAGAIIVAVGAREHVTKEFGYGECERIFSLSEFEKVLFEPDSGVRNGRNFAFIQCVDSRNDRRPFCSRICCSEAILNSLKIKETNPDAEVYVLYRDIMTY
ncbi:MAG: FAD-dependent oxidoreductase, partial [bacterium]